MSRLTLSAAGGASPGRPGSATRRSRAGPGGRRRSARSPAARRGSAPAPPAACARSLGVGVDFVVDSVDETARVWVWTVRKGPLTLHLDHRVVSEGSGTRTTLGMAGPLPVLLAYAPLARLAIGRLVRPQLLAGRPRGSCRVPAWSGRSTTLWASPGTFPGWSAGRARLTLNQDKRRRFDSYPGSTRAAGQRPIAACGFLVLRARC